MLRYSSVLLLVAACSGDITVPDEGMTTVVATGLDGTFQKVGAETRVPPELLAAIGWVETRWQMVDGHEELDGAPRAVGLMAIGDDQLDAAAAAAGVDAQDIAEDPESNVRAAAALLAANAPTDRSDLAAWAQAVADYSRIDDPEMRADFVIHEVYGVLQRGVTATAEDGEVIATIAAHPGLVPDYDATFPAYATGADYSGAVWKPSPNYGSRPSGTAGKVSLVIIHDCEGNYAGCVGWLRNSASQVSAHYVVKEDGGEIAQLVKESNRAWHIAAAYKCSLNGNTMCDRNGASSNNFTVGIEHAGFASQASWPAGQISASAKLVCDITKRNGIPRDNHHIVGHGQLQPYNRVDPGPNWPWADYLDQIRTACGDGGGTPPPTGGTIVVDSNNANNDAATGRITLTGTWTSSNATAGYYGSGYWYAETSNTSAPATFEFYLASAGTRTIDAWWTAGTNRSTAATFIAQDPDGNELGRKTVDQTTNGSQWVTLGTWSFHAGWNKVILSRWQAAGSVVIADAIRAR